MRTMWWMMLLAAAILFACENENKSAKDDVAPADTEAVVDNDLLLTDETPDEAVDETPEEVVDEVPDVDGFNPGDPGYNIFFQIMTMEFFGQQTAMAFGVIMKTAREDLEPEEGGEEQELDTCVFLAGTETPTPSCTSKEDCAPEQECLPETDNNGNPIAGTERCVTPNRESLDRGPVTITGFNGGPATFLYEPNDKVYKLNGTGDGSIDIGTLAFNTTYELSGEGQDDLATFSSSVFMPPALALVSPEATTGGSLPFPMITIDPSVDLTVQWADANPGGVLDLTVTGEQGSVVCRVNDDGEFTVPADLLSQVTFGTGFNAMANNLILDRKYTEPMSGATVTAGTFNTEEMVMYLINAVQ